MRRFPSFVVRCAVVCAVCAAPVVASAPAHAETVAPAAAPADVAANPFAEAAELVEVKANSQANLQRAIALYEGALVDEKIDVKQRTAAWTDLSRAYLRLGDLLGSNDAKLAAYTKGKAAGDRGFALDGKAADALFWATANQACIGRTRGVLNSLFMIPDLRKDLQHVLQIAPGHAFAQDTLGEIDHAVPGFAGGSDARAEAAYRAVLGKSPHFTKAMVLLALLKADNGDKDEARQWAQKVLDEKTPARPNDHRKFDVPDARKILAGLSE